MNFFKVAEFTTKIENRLQNKNQQKQKTYMKTTQVLACSLAVGAMIFAAGKASAVPQKLNLSGTFTYQLPPSTSGTVTTSKTKTVSFNNNTIIAALNASAVFTTAASMTIPAGSYLVMDSDNNSIIVTNRTGTVNINLTTLPYVNNGSGFSGFAIYNNTSEADVFSGKQNSSTQQESGNELRVTASLFITDGAGLTINIKGLEKSSKSASNVNLTTGLQNVTISGSLTGVGAGSYQGYNAVVQGTGTASGSGKQ